MSLVETLHHAHMERLARLGGIPKPWQPEPEPVRVAGPVVVKVRPLDHPVIDKSYYPQMWFWELVNFIPRFCNQSITIAPTAPSIHLIQRVVCRRYDITRNDILSQRRTANLVRPRQVAMYITKTLTPKSLPEIGRRFGDRDHTTVLHAVRKIEHLITRDPILAAQIEDLKAEILAS